MENRDFIIIGLPAWDLPIATTRKYTALEISHKNRVLFVNLPETRTTYIKQKENPLIQKRKRILQGKEPNLVQVSPTLWVLYPRVVSESINWIPVHPLFFLLNYLNERAFASEIKKAVKDLGFHDYIILNDNSMLNGYFLKELLKPSLYIYLLRDAVTLVPYHRKHGSVLEPKLIAKSDLVVTNSSYFCNYAKLYNPNSHTIGQGCDVSMYNDQDGKLPLPEDVREIQRPIIGYTGALTTIRLDIGILEFVAKAHPDWSLVMVGPEDETFQKSVLHQLPNVHFLGRKDPDTLPGYVKSFDVAINPQLHNPITDVNYPLKIDEYLAMGKPVVATKTAFMDYFKDHTHLASSYEEWVDHIEEALQENTSSWIAKRKALATEHSWENFVGKIYTLSMDVENKREQPISPDCDIVITGLQSWYMSMGGNAVNLAKELSKHHRVLYVNYAVDRLALLLNHSTLAVKKYKESKANPYATIEQVSDNLWVYTPDVVMESVGRIKPRWIFNRLNAINAKRFGKKVRQAVLKLGFHDFVVLTDNDFYRSFKLKEILHPALFIYYIRDYMIDTDFYRSHGPRMEEAIMRKADLVAANSEFLAAYARKYNPNSFYVGQGCDSELFNPERSYKFPDDMKEIREKFKVIVGYVGALRVLRIDIKLLEFIAVNRPEWALVLVGWEGEVFQKSKLHELPNVFFLDSKPESELPRYIHAFDVAINPQVYNAVTKGNYPRKIDEYLAMGKPVVATRTEAMEMFSNYCFLGTTPEDYCKLIEEAFRTDTPELHEKRIRLGRLHSWENNTRELFKAIEKVRPS
ncbi:MAG: glycosyltransferase family 1 protein [Bacteroidetes bacterium]|nr:MAG: glycosyltransferase family 1 protein [Bacteroidota bacterium]